MSKTIKSKSGRTLIVPSLHEDEAINRAAMSDADAKPLTDAQWEEVKPKLRRGRPRAATTKILTTIRLDADVLAGMKSTGRGWQTRINLVMREWVRSNAPAVSVPMTKSPVVSASKRSARTRKGSQEQA